MNMEVFRDPKTPSAGSLEILPKGASGISTESLEDESLAITEGAEVPSYEPPPQEELWAPNATAEAYESYQETPEVLAYQERKKEYVDVISQWSDHIEGALAEDGHTLNEEELHDAISTRERMRQEMVEVSSNYPGDWTGLLYKRVTDPLTKEKFVATRTLAMETMRDGEVGMLDKPKHFKAHYQNQIDNYDQTVGAVFGSTKIGNQRPRALGSSTGIGDPGIVYDGAHQKDGTLLTSRQKNIIEAHEKGHGLRDFESDIDANEIGSIIDPQVLNALTQIKRESGDQNFTGTYTREPAEIIERMAQFKNYFGMDATEKFTKQHLDRIRKQYVIDTGLDNGVTDLLTYITPETEGAFLKVINKYPI